MIDRLFNLNSMSNTYKILPADELRKTEDVLFHKVPLVDGVDALTRVEHGPGAFSPGSVDDVENPWYMHAHQEDNLIVFRGTRHVDLYSREEGKVLHFDVTPDKIILNGEVAHEGPAILSWPVNVFHRVRSGEDGSMSLNFAARSEGFDIRTNFNIYDLDTESGEFTVLREGHLDQPDTTV
jgi:hypothetical protein